MAQKKNGKGFCLITYWYLLKLMSWLWDVSNSIYVRLVLMVNILLANEGDLKDTSSIPALGRSPGEGNDNPLQYSCLENPMDRGTLQATVHGIAKSLTWQKWPNMLEVTMHARLLMLACVKVNQLLFYTLVVTYKAWKHKIFQKFQNFFSWNFQRHLSCSPSYLDFFCPCTWSLCLETCLSSWAPSQTPTSTPPCTSSSPTCLL